MKTTVVSSLLAPGAIAMGVALSGCDFLDKFQQKTNKAEVQILQQAAVEQTRREEAQQQAKNECAALRHFVSLKLTMLTKARSDADKELAQLSADRKSLSGRIGEISDKNMADKNGTAATALNLMLKDETINALAAKYLEGDFAMVRGEFVEKMRETLRREREMKQALQRNQASLDRSASEERDRIKRARAEMRNAVAELKAKIASKENRLRSLRSAMRGSKEQQRQREREILNLEREVSDLKVALQHESSTSSFTKAREDEMRADQVRRQAAREKREADELLAKQNRNMESPERIAEEYEQQTVKRLLAALQERNVEITGRQNLLDEQITYLRHVTDGIDSFDVAGVKRVRADVETELARTDVAEGEKPKNGR